MASNKNALGKGLGALLESAKTDITSKPSTFNNNQAGLISRISIANISPNPFQPRIDFEKNSLLELPKSIKEHGIIQPITVRKMGRDNFQIISGERRFQAAKIAQIIEIPCYIRIADDKEMLEMAIVENIQREDLDPIEIALSYNRLLKEINLTQEELSLKIGKERSTISNYIRLLKLDPIIQSGLRDKFLTMGHARALINIKEKDKQIENYKKIIKNGISVKDTEKLLSNTKKTLKKEKNNYKSKFINQAENKLKELLDTDISVHSNNSGKGYIKIEFKSQENLENIVNKIKSD